LRPTFVGSLQPVETPLWSDAVWALPDQTDLAPGSFLFTQDAEFVGVVIATATRRVVMPGSTLFAEAERLLERPRAPPGRLGVRVQRLTSVLVAATGSAGGVVVSWVDPRGPAIGRLNVGDVLEALDGRAIASVEHWLVPIARLAENDKLELRVRRQGQVHSVTLIAAGDRPPETGRALGLTLRARRRLGAEVIGVELRSAGDRADVRVGDVITLIGPVAAPTPEQVRRAFSATPRGQPVLIALTRDDSHLVTALER
jgi:S1-C subfamily serine protease